MNRKYRLLLIISLSLLLCGCNVEYNIIINEDLSIKESIIVDDGQSRTNPVSMLNKVITDYGEYYDIILNDDFECIDQCNERDIYPFSIIASKEYKNFSELSKSYAINYYYGEIKYSSGKGISRLNTLPAQRLQAFLTLVDKAPKLVDNLVVKIYVPFLVTKHNADSVSNNYYSWNYNSENLDKEIELEFDINKKVDYNGNVNSNNDNTIGETNTSSNITKYILYAIIVFAILIIIIFIISKKEENNAL